jgi:hypothetical protein
MPVTLTEIALPRLVIPIMAIAADAVRRATL